MQRKGNYASVRNKIEKLKKYARKSEKDDINLNWEIGKEKRKVEEL